jgi:hypothetical protein
MTPATRGFANLHTTGAFRGVMMRSIVRGKAGPRRYPGNGDRRTTPDSCSDLSFTAPARGRRWTLSSAIAPWPRHCQRCP